MIAVIQRVTRASVTVRESPIASIGQGLLVLLGVAKGDTERDVAFMVGKIPEIRLFSDEAGKMNRSLRDIHGTILVVSQFTLLADTSRGRRPSFEQAAPPDEAKTRYQQVVDAFQQRGIAVQTGIFGETMQVSLDNDGPVTVLLDSRAKNTVMVKKTTHHTDTMKEEHTSN
jgi:D-aminoacyl-tRNA deacylase